MMKPARSLVASAGLAAALLLGGGCATAPLPGDAFVQTSDPKLLGTRVRDRVLWQCRFGLAALRAGQIDEARRRFDDAILSLGGIFTDTADARRARSLWGAEAGKIFIGEPYERSLAFFYRGLLYWMDGEHDNARACFRSAEMMDAVAADADYRADWLLPDYLDGWASRRLGGDGTEALARVRAATSRAVPDYDPAAGVLVVAEWGRGPLKFADGPHGELLRFAESFSEVARAELRVGDQVIELSPWDDVYFQATTRGGRAMDFILGQKAVFKDAADTVGDAALVGALIAADRGSEGATNTALALAAVGLFSKVLSGAANAAADTRTWDNLPRYLSFAALRLPPGEHAARVNFLRADGSVASTQSLRLRVPERGDLLLFVSEHAAPAAGREIGREPRG
jgi:prepilin-type processing-associated H-X9-DG protein